MKLDKQKILNEAPEGATHYYARDGYYYEVNAKGIYGSFTDARYDPDRVKKSISLDDLRAMPDALFYVAVNFDSFIEYRGHIDGVLSVGYDYCRWQEARRTLKLDVSEEVEPDPKRSKYHREIKPGVWVG